MANRGESAVEQVVIKASDLSGQIRLIVEEVAKQYMEEIIRRHLEDMIATAKDSATKSIAAKLLETALKDL